MKDQDRVAHDAFIIAARGAEQTEVQAQLGNGLACAKMKVIQDVIAFHRRGIIRRTGKSGRQRRQQE
jgi:hypothetical protein